MYFMVLLLVVGVRRTVLPDPGLGQREAEPFDKLSADSGAPCRIVHPIVVAHGENRQRRRTIFVGILRAGAPEPALSLSMGSRTRSVESLNGPAELFGSTRRHLCQAMVWALYGQMKGTPSGQLLVGNQLALV